MYKLMNVYKYIEFVKNDLNASIICTCSIFIWILDKISKNFYNSRIKVLLKWSAFSVPVSIMRANLRIFFLTKSLRALKIAKSAKNCKLRVRCVQRWYLTILLHPHLKKREKPTIFAEFFPQSTVNTNTFLIFIPMIEMASL